MANILVTLISEQAIPNVQFIKEFQPSDAYLFISTPKMEDKNKSKSIIDTWLKKALQEHGIGAKTAVGYGYFQ